MDARAWLARHGALAAITVLGLGIALSAILGLPPWGGDQAPWVRILVVLAGIALPVIEALRPRLRARYPERVPPARKRWSRSALWGVFFVGCGVLALPDFAFASTVLIVSGLFYLAEAWAIRPPAPAPEA